MERKLKRTLLLFMVCAAGLVAKAEENGAAGSTFNWNPIMDAIIQVESKGNPNAVSGKSCGAMQITPVLVEECNVILKKRKSKKRFTLSDRFSLAKSKEMFLLFQSHYNPKNSVEQAIRSWNGGMRYTVRGTQSYYNKVMRLLKIR